MDQRIGKYVIHKAAVTAGYARVYFCHDPDLQVPVAVKLFRPRPDDLGPLSPAMLLNRFLTEARILAGFDHPHIVSVKALETLEDGRPYFVMPYKAAALPYEMGKDRAGPEAPEHDRPRRIPLPRAVALLRQVCSALLALHRRGMVHRAVMPSNILLTAREGGSVKLCDFSMIKLADRNLPLPDHWIGSPDYTAPEQRESATSVTPRADVYSLGVLACRMITGRLPDASAGPAEAGPDALPALAELIHRCTASDPAERPPHAGDVLALLGKIPTQNVPRPVVQVVAARRMAAAPVS